MLPCIDNPRRTRRVSVHLDVSVTSSDGTFHAVALDVGPGGCLLVAGRALSTGARLSLLLTAPDVPDPLRVGASVVWVRGGRCGVAFERAASDQNDASRWFEALLMWNPRLRSLVTRTPAHLPLSTAIASRPVCSERATLPIDERVLLSQVAAPTPVRAVAFRSRIPPDRFARALFALLEKGIVVAA